MLKIYYLLHKFYAQLYSFMKLNKGVYRVEFTDKYLSAIMRIVYSQALNSNIEKSIAG